MARHTQDVASPQFPTIISPPRSSRSPSLSFVPPLRQKSKPQHIPIPSISALSQISPPRNSPPPDFLLDDDPFANLTGFVCRQLSAKATSGDVNYISIQPTPTNLPGFRGMGTRSSFPSIASLSSSAGWSSQPEQPLNSPPAIPQSQPQPPPPPAIPQSQPQSQPQPQPQPSLILPPAIPRPLHHTSLSSTKSLPLPHRPSPAHQRPAFKSRPSLPSLNTLSKMNFSGFGVRKVRKGKVGAGLPFEPWNDLHSRPSSGETSSVEEEDETVVGSGPGPAPPLPSLISVLESASTSENESGDSNISSHPFPPRSSSFSVPPSLSPTSSSYTATDMPPYSVSVASSLGLDGEVGAVYGSCDRSGKMRSPPRSPPQALSTTLHASFPAVDSTSGSSTSSSNEDDEDHYGPHSRTTSSTSATSPGYITPPLETLAVSRSNGSRFSESEDDDDIDDDDEDDDNDDDDDDDDIPLAQRIPGALTAQKSIRSQVRQERERKKQEKALRYHAEETRTRLMTLRPSAVPSSSHDAAAASQTTTDRNSRPLTRNSSRSLNPFSREDSLRKRGINGPDDVEAATTPVDATSLYQRLHSLHRSKSITRSLGDVRPPSTEALPPVPIPITKSLRDVRPPSTEALRPVPIPQSHPPSSQAQGTKSVKEPSSLPYRFPTSPSPTPINSTYAPSSITPLRPKRSFHFHRPSIDSRPIGMDDPSSVPLPSDAEKRISQNYTNMTRSRSSTRDGPQQPSTFPSATQTHHHHRSLSRSRGSFERASPSTIPESVPILPIPTTTRISHGSNRISADADKHSRAHRQALSASSPADPLPMIKPELVVQQRVFIGNMQRFNMVEISASTTAGDIIEMIKAEGTFKDFAGREGWMVFEVAQDFGMERPIRSFELVTDVQASWNKDKMVNYLVLRMTPLEVPLNRWAIPSSSPTHSGYVEWEAKRGKWSKRFLQLREHSLWISKRESGQDQVHLCSLSNFDAYRVTRTHRAPKPFSFAVKSTDNLSLFENTADYLHSFACSEKEGKIWMEKILVARSYVLFQERHVLFNPKAAVGNSSGVSRSGTGGTRKATTTIQRPHHDIFEPGSLLSK